MANVLGGFQPDTKAPSSRRADFDLRRRIAELELQVAAAAARNDALTARLAALETRAAAAAVALALGIPPPGIPARLTALEVRTANASQALTPP